MKIQIRCEQTGQEILDNFIRFLNENKIEPALENIKFIIQNSKGADVEVAADKVRLVFNKE